MNLLLRHLQVYLIAFIGVVFWTEATAGDTQLDAVAQLTKGPSGMSVAPDGDLILSLHQVFETRERVIRMDRNGDWGPWPTVTISTGENSAVALDAIMGIRTDETGKVWMLDNGRRGESVPKIVGWNPDTGQIEKIYHIPAPAVRETSFLADFAIDPEGFFYIADPASGEDAAIIVLDARTNLARRVLEGHYSVIPEDVPLIVQGQKLEVLRPDGTVAEPLTGVNPIALGARNRYLFFGPMKGHTLYRIDTLVLRDEHARPETVRDSVESWSRKPICDSIAVDRRGNVYVADVVRQAIAVIEPEPASNRRPEVYITDPRLAWPDGLTFGPDGRLYFYCSQLNRTGWYNAGRDFTTSPFFVYRIKPLSQGLIPNPLSNNPITNNPITDRIGDRFRSNPR